MLEVADDDIRVRVDKLVLHVLGCPAEGEGQLGITGQALRLDFRRAVIVIQERHARPALGDVVVHEQFARRQLADDGIRISAADDRRLRLAGDARHFLRLDGAPVIAAGQELHILQQAHLSVRGATVHRPDAAPDACDQVVGLVEPVLPAADALDRHCHVRTRPIDDQQGRGRIARRVRARNVLHQVVRAVAIHIAERAVHRAARPVILRIHSVRFLPEVRQAVAVRIHLRVDQVLKGQPGGKHVELARQVRGAHEVGIHHEVDHAHALNLDALVRDRGDVDAVVLQAAADAQKLR